MCGIDTLPPLCCAISSYYAYAVLLFSKVYICHIVTCIIFKYFCNIQFSVTSCTASQDRQEKATVHVNNPLTEAGALAYRWYIPPSFTSENNARNPS